MNPKSLGKPKALKNRRKAKDYNDYGRKHSVHKSSMSHLTESPIQAESVLLHPKLTTIKTNAKPNISKASQYETTTLKTKDTLTKQRRD